MARVLLVRHGLVENPAGVVYGRLPGFALSAEGRAQAARTASRLAGEPLDAIYSSPMQRAQETAAIIADRHPDRRVQLDERLHEVRWVREGIPGAEFRRYRLRCYDPAVMLPGDESIDEIATRLRDFLADMGRRYPGGTVAAVTHGDPVAVARALAAGRPLTVEDFERDYPPPASVMPILVGYDGTLAIEGAVSGPRPAGEAAADGAAGGPA